MAKDIEFCNDVSEMKRVWSVKEQVDAPEVPGIHPVSLAVAAMRGFDPVRFFAPSLRTEMPDPSILKGMDEAVARFCDAVIARKRIAVYGDYDVDGATSTSMVIRWLNAMGLPSEFYIPNRMTEGYGPNADAIRRLKAERDIEFILFLDCGTTAHAQLGVAADLGIEMVIIDHHEQDNLDPPAVLVNPKRRDETGDFSYLCTAGLVFLFLVAVQREMRVNRGYFDDERVEVDLRKWLGIVALGTVCDIVPLKGLNRAYVHVGMPKMGEIPGLAALATANGDPVFNERACGFVFGPCINAEGRIGDTRSGTNLLVADDPEKAHEYARLLVETNKERQAMTKEAVDRAIEKARTTLADRSTVVIYDPEIHPGIAGIVAGKVKDAVNKPAVVIGQGGTGSCRSVTGYSIGSAVLAARVEAGIIEKGGGHAMAAGLHCSPNRVAELDDFLCSKSDGFVHPPLEVDLAFECGKLKPDVLKAMDAQLKPFGMENPTPRIAIHGGYVSRVRVLPAGHVELTLAGRYGSCRAMMWNGVGTPLGDALSLSADKFVDVYGKARVDSHVGRESILLVVEDAMIRQEQDAEAA